MNYDTVIKSADAEATTTVRFDDFGGEVPTDGARHRRLYLIIAAIVGVLAVIAIAGFLLKPSAGEADAGAAPQLQAVSVVSPGRTTVAGAVTATGTLAARRDIPVGVVGEGGRVVSVPVEQGQWVRQGQVLAVIDRSVQSQQAQSAAASINVAQADARLAQANLDRALQLVDRGFISKAEVDRLTATRDAASARVRVSQAQYRELLARNARLNVLAPVSGLLLERNVEPGAVVGGGTPALFRIAQGGEMELQARLGEVDLARISTGQQAEVVPVGTDQVFTGQIWQIEPTIDPANRQGIARVALAYSPELRPGGFASATISSGTLVAPVLPESAIMSDDEGSYVYIVDAANKVVRRPVRTGNVTPSGIIIADGLAGTERVILRAGGFLNPGEEVKPVVAKAPAE